MRIDVKLINKSCNSLTRDYHFAGVASTHPLNLDPSEKKETLRNQFIRAEAYIDYIFDDLKLRAKDELAEKYHELLKIGRKQSV